MKQTAAILVATTFALAPALAGVTAVPLPPPPLLPEPEPEPEPDPELPEPLPPLPVEQVEPVASAARLLAAGQAAIAEDTLALLALPQELTALM